MKKELKGLLIGIFCFIFYLFSFSIVYRLTNLIGLNYDKLSLFYQYLYDLGYELLLVSIIIFIFRKTFIPNLKLFIKDFKKYLDEYFKYWILILVLMLISNIIIAPFATESAVNQQSVVDLLVKYPVVIFIEAVFIAPILEELIFRKCLRNIIYFNKPLYIILSGLIFGFMHVMGESTLGGFLYIIPYSIPGMVFAYTYVKSDNICVPISIHLIHNFTLILLNLFL